MLSCTKMYRINQLLKQPQKTFHTPDLALLWQITAKNTLYTAIKRYLQKGVLISLSKGFYSVIPPDDLNPWALGISFLHRYAYVSTETILFQAGLISQKIYPITLVSSVSKRFSVNGLDFLCRKLPDDRLYDSTGLELKNGILVASPKRAKSDLLYFDPGYHFDQKI